MALSLNITFGAPCATGEHFRVTASLSGAVTKSISFDGSRVKALATPTEEDIETTIYVLLKLMILQLANKSNANIKTVVEGKTINLTVTG